MNDICKKSGFACSFAQEDGDCGALYCAMGYENDEEPSPDDDFDEFFFFDLLDED